MGSLLFLFMSPVTACSNVKSNLVKASKLALIVTLNFIVEYTHCHYNVCLLSCRVFAVIAVFADFRLFSFSLLYSSSNKVLCVYCSVFGPVCCFSLCCYDTTPPSSTCSSINHTQKAASLCSYCESTP